MSSDPEPDDDDRDDALLRQLALARCRDDGALREQLLLVEQPRDNDDAPGRVELQHDALKLLGIGGRHETHVDVRSHATAELSQIDPGCVVLDRAARFQAPCALGHGVRAETDFAGELSVGRAPVFDEQTHVVARDDALRLYLRGRRHPPR